MDNRQHVDQAATQSIVGSLALTKAFDLRKDLQLTALRDDFADHAAGPQAFAAVFEYTLSTASREGRACRNGGNPISFRLRDGRVRRPDSRCAAIRGECGGS